MLLPQWHIITSITGCAKTKRLLKQDCKMNRHDNNSYVWDHFILDGGYSWPFHILSLRLLNAPFLNDMMLIVVFYFKTITMFAINIITI